MKTLVVGGLGYVGSVLVQELLEQKYKVKVFDLNIYNFKTFENSENLEIIEGDVRNLDSLKYAVNDCDTVIHLACISNDPSFDLDPTLGKSINLDFFDPFIKICKENSVKRFIYASSSSVYGVKKEENVHEKMSLEPLTDYSKYKAACEKILLKYQSEKFCTTIVRPATVCGFSPRQRFDLVVNLLSNLALNNRDITVFGGSQLRPNIHIKDMVRAYLKILESPISKIAGEIFNVGYENMKVIDIAFLVKKIINPEINIKILESNDNRSYHISSKKISSHLDFTSKFSVADAIKDIKDAYDEGYFFNSLGNEMYFNIKRMKAINLK